MREWSAVCLTLELRTCKPRALQMMSRYGLGEGQLWLDIRRRTARILNKVQRFIESRCRSEKGCKARDLCNFLARLLEGSTVTKR
jgi:hypothetical protein